MDPRPGYVFDGLITTLGVSVAIVGAALWVVERSDLTAANVVAAVLVVVMTQFPLTLPQKAGDAAIGFEASALVFLALTTSAGEALTLWAAGQVVSQLTQDRSLRVRLFNVGITNLGGGALVGVVVLGRHLVGHTTGPELATTLVACSAYFLADLLVTTVSFSIEAGDHNPVGALRWRAVPLPLLCFVGIDTLGYLGALLVRKQPIWTLALLLVPIGTILVAVRSINSSRISHDRLGRLFVAASTAPDWGDAAQTERQLVLEAQEVLRRSTCAILDRAAIGEEISTPFEVRNQPKRYVVAWRSKGAPKFDGDDRRALETLVGIASAAINRRSLADEMTHLARHDALTGLANRTVFTDRLDHALELRRSSEGVESVAILYCDLDGFKSVNDRRGHESGDRLLERVAERIASCLRPGDTAARLGGDEFAVLLERVQPGGAEQVAERILRHVAGPIVIDGREVRVTASIGIAYVSDEIRAVDVMRHADTAMYRAKADGKNRYEVFHPKMQRDSLTKLRLEDELRLAVRDRSFTVAYQPVVALGSGEIEGYEALARWHHAELGTIPPEVFVPLAERLGFIGEIGLHILEHALDGAQLLQARHGRPISIAVNVSPLQISDPELVRRVRTAVVRHPDVHLILELTEMSRLGEDESNIRALEELVSAGAEIAVDDFGTGYSSISYLHRLPVGIVKIDKSFTRDLTAARSLPVVQGVIAMAQAMDLRVVAEGIEDGETARRLWTMGAQRGQGFWFARPMALPEALDRLHGIASPSNAWSYAGGDERPDNVRAIRGSA